MKTFQRVVMTFERACTVKYKLILNVLSHLEMTILFLSVWGITWGVRKYKSKQEEAYMNNLRANFERGMRGVAEERGVRIQIQPPIRGEPGGPSLLDPILEQTKVPLTLQQLKANVEFFKIPENVGKEPPYPQMWEIDLGV